MASSLLEARNLALRRRRSRSTWCPQQHHSMIVDSRSRHAPALPSTTARFTRSRLASVRRQASRCISGKFQQTTAIHRSSSIPPSQKTHRRTDFNLHLAHLTIESTSMSGSCRMNPLSPKPRTANHHWFILGASTPSYVYSLQYPSTRDQRCM